MRQLALHALRKQLRSEYAHAEWLIKQRELCINNLHAVSCV